MTRILWLFIMVAVVGLLREAQSQAPREPKLLPKDLEEMWESLALSDDQGVTKAYKSIRVLIRSPTQAVAFLRERLKPTPPLNTKKVNQWIADLDSNQYETRETATKELEKLGRLILPTLRKTLDHPESSLEARRRVEGLVKRLDVTHLFPDELRASRAIEVLFALGDAPAKEVLEVLAKGEPAAKVTQDAKSALALLARRAKP